MLESIAGVDAAKAAAQPIAGAHSIWELVLHIAAWDKAVARRLGGDPGAVSDEENFPVVDDQSEASWQRAIETMKQNHRDLMEAAMGLRPPAELDRIAQENATALAAGDDDPEPLYRHGAVLAFVGKKEAAVHMIRMAIEQNYCAYSDLENDPLLEKLRATPEFADLLKAARFCQEPLLAEGK